MVALHVVDLPLSPVLVPQPLAVEQIAFGILLLSELVVHLELMVAIVGGLVCFIIGTLDLFFNDGDCC